MFFCSGFVLFSDTYFGPLFLNPVSSLCRFLVFILGIADPSRVFVLVVSGLGGFFLIVFWTRLILYCFFPVFSFFFNFYFLILVPSLRSLRLRLLDEIFALVLSICLYVGCTLRAIICYLAPYFLVALEYSYNGMMHFITVIYAYIILIHFLSFLFIFSRQINHWCSQIEISSLVNTQSNSKAPIPSSCT